MNFKPSRINVVGTSGSGKTSFSKRLAAVLNYPYIEMDKVYWKPNWQEPTDEEFFPKLSAELEGPKWVLDGNYNRTRAITWAQVDLVIWLDFSFSTTLFQVISRSLKRAWTKQELWSGTGNRESFRKSFLSKSSIIWWMITTHRRNRKRYESVLVDPKYNHIKFVRLKSHSEAEEFLNGIS